MTQQQKGDRRQDRGRARRGNRRGGFLSMIVEPYRQVRLGLMVLLVNTLFGLCIGGIFSYYIIDIHDVLSVYFQFNPTEDQQVWQKFWVILLLCLSLVAVFFVLTFVVIIKYTHQIYGPLVSLHNHLDQLIAGTAKSPINMRSTDQLQALAQKINQLSSFSEGPLDSPKEKAPEIHDDSEDPQEGDEGHTKAKDADTNGTDENQLAKAN